MIGMRLAQKLMTAGKSTKKKKAFPIGTLFHPGLPNTYTHLIWLTFNGVTWESWFYRRENQDTWSLDTSLGRGKKATYFLIGPQIVGT